MRSFKIITSLFLITACAFCLVLGGCKKKEIPGPQGDPGAPGSNGTSYITTHLTPVISSQWVADSTAGRKWKTSIVTSLITKEVFDKGSVKVFMAIGSSWQELPFLDDDTFTQYGFGVGIVNFEISDLHGDLPPMPGTSNFRIVVISENGRVARMDVKCVSGRVSETINISN